MTIGEKVSYIKGLAEGLKVDESTNEGKVITAILDVLGEMAENLAEVDEELDDVADVMTDLEESVSDLEDDVYGYDEDEDEMEDDDFDEDLDEMYGDHLSYMRQHYPLRLRPGCKGRDRLPELRRSTQVLPRRRGRR